MSGMMLHGLGDCTPEQNCGCMSGDVRAEAIVDLVDSLIEARRQRDAAEARARRAEDTLRALRDKLTYAVKPCSDPDCGYCMERRDAINPALTVANAALSAADQASDATPSDTTTQGD